MSQRDVLLKVKPRQLQSQIRGINKDIESAEDAFLHFLAPFCDTSLEKEVF